MASLFFALQLQLHDWQGVHLVSSLLLSASCLPLGNQKVNFHCAR